MVKEKSGAKVLLFYETQVAMRKYIVSFLQKCSEEDPSGYFTTLLWGGWKDRFSQTQ